MIDTTKKYQQIQALLKQNKYEDAVFQIQQCIKTEDFLSMITNIFESNQNKTDEDYQYWIHIYSLSITQQLYQQKWITIYSQMINQLLAVTSPKFGIIIIKSTLHKLKENVFGRFILSSFFHLFYSIVADPAVVDLIDVYKEFQHSFTQLQPTKNENNQKSIILDKRDFYCKNLMQFLDNVLGLYIKVNTKFVQQVINLSNSILKNLLQYLNKETNFQNFSNGIANPVFIKVPLGLISKLNINMQALRPTFFFVNAFLIEYTQKQSKYVSFIYSPQWIIQLLIRTINNELLVDLSSPPKFNRLQQYFLINSIDYLCDRFTNFTIQLNELTQSHYDEIQEFIQKINIYIGSVNPQEILYNKILKTFIRLPFLNLEVRERLYSKLISKHKNEGFKVHLITQYRQLLNPACTRTVWIRSTTLLFKELKLLQPNTSIDYIGHILSMAFFWKELLKRFLKQPNFKKKCFLNISELEEQFTENLIKLKQGLEMKVQVSQSQNNEMERNEANLCIFRISEILQK